MDGQRIPVPRGITGWVGNRTLLQVIQVKRSMTGSPTKISKSPWGPLMGLLFEFYESKGILNGTFGLTFSCVFFLSIRKNSPHSQSATIPSQPSHMTFPPIKFVCCHLRTKRWKSWNEQGSWNDWKVWKMANGSLGSNPKKRGGSLYRRAEEGAVETKDREQLSSIFLIKQSVHESLEGKIPVQKHLDGFEHDLMIWFEPSFSSICSHVFYSFPQIFAKHHPGVGGRAVRWFLETVKQQC